MSSTAAKIRETQLQLARLQEQALAEQAETERARLEEERKAVLAQKQREVVQREERIARLRADIKKYEEQVQDAQRTLSYARDNLYCAKNSLEMTLNPPPPKPQKDPSKCSCETVQTGVWESEHHICSYCSKNGY